MITAFFMQIFYYVFLAAPLTILSAIPAIPNQAFDAVAWFIAVLPSLAVIIPYNTVFQIVGLQLIIGVVIAGWDYANWVLNKLRGSGS